MFLGLGSWIIFTSRKKKGSGENSSLERTGTSWSKIWNISTLLDLLILASIIWVANYFYFHSLGLYEDDYTYISQPLGWNISQMVRLSHVFINWPQGRPLGYFMTYWAAFIAGKLGGLSTVYLFAFVVQALNVVLCYLLLMKIGTRLSAFTGALFFGLFPADTTHVFLMHSLGLHTSLTFLLIASLLYLTRNKPLSYVFALGSLLTYETPYMVFLAVPLLGQSWDRKMVRELVRHLLIWVTILGLVAAARFMLGEGRILEAGSSAASIGTIALETLQALFIGPAVSLYLIGYGPASTLGRWNLALTFVFIASAVLFAWLFYWKKVSLSEVEDASPTDIHRKLFGFPLKLHLSILYPKSVKLLVTGLVMLSLAYGFSFTHFPPTTLHGRMTSVHMAAALGGAIFFAGLIGWLLAFARDHRWGGIANGLVVVYLSLLVAYGFSIQLDYRQAWQNQQKFWTNVLQDSPDLTDGTLIFVQNHDLPTTHFILSNSWADPIVLAQIYKFPSTWEQVPRLFVVQSNWTDLIHRSGEGLEWEVPRATWPVHWEILPDANVILLEMENGRLVRRYGSLEIQGETLHLKTPGPDTVSDLKKGALYPYLIGTDAFGK